MAKIVIIKPNKTHREQMRFRYWLKKGQLERLGTAYLLSEANDHIDDLLVFTGNGRISDMMKRKRSNGKGRKRNCPKMNPNDDESL
jgi:hypothetical protein